MAAGSASIAMRSARACSRACATPAYRLSGRPSTLQKRVVVQQRGSLRHASSETAGSNATETPKQQPGGFRRAVVGASAAFAFFAGYVYLTDTRASAHRYVLVPLIRALYPDAEEAHHVGVDSLKHLYTLGLHPRERGDPDGDGALATEVLSYSHYAP